MHKRLEADLMSLAHSILKMKNKEDVFALKEKSKEVYEKLSLLSFVEEYVNTTPGIEETKEELLAAVEKGFDVQQTKVKESAVADEVLEKEAVTKEVVKEYPEVLIAAPQEEIIEQPFDELEEILFSETDTLLEEEIEEEKENEDAKIEEEPEIIELVKEEKEEEIVAEEEVEKEILEELEVIEEEKEGGVLEKRTVSLEEELQDTIPVDEIANLFNTPVQTSLNDRLSTRIQIGLNDRIAFVKHLFEGSQEDFNRVVSQLNTYSSEKEANRFIHKMVKPDYDWSTKEDIEARFLEIVARKFA